MLSGHGLRGLKERKMDRGVPLGDLQWVMAMVPTLHY